MFNKPTSRALVPASLFSLVLYIRVYPMPTQIVQQMLRKLMGKLPSNIKLVLKSC